LRLREKRENRNEGPQAKDISCSMTSCGSPDKLTVKSKVQQLTSFFAGNIFIYYVIFSAIFSQRICQAQQWISVSDSQTEILTSGNEAEARAALQLFENARKFFLNSSAFPAAFNKPVRIFAFQSKGEYAPYRLNSNAFGHFLHSRKADYIVLEDIKPEHYEAALHEYTHYAAKQAGLNLPV